jgi:AraC-like DNA-binding protein
MSGRLTRHQIHNDGVNVWDTARIAPPSLLEPAIYGYSDYWERTAGFATRRELPHAEGVLIINLGPPVSIIGGDGEAVAVATGAGFVAGAHLRPALSHAPGEQAGMHVFLPLVTLRRLLGVPMGQLANKVVLLDAILGVEARALGTRLAAAWDREARIALLDQALTGWFARTAPVSRQQAHALAMLRGRPDLDIARIAREIGWSRKHFATVTRDAVGVGPRSFRRLLRFQTLIASIGGAAPRDWAGLACGAGYCDQSHMIREFREFSFMTPGAYAARLLPDGGGLVEA